MNRDDDLGVVLQYEGDFTNGSPFGEPCDGMRDALTVLRNHGWQEGRMGVQYGHLYCPQHNERTIE